MPPIIEIRNLSKMYRIGAHLHKDETFRELLVRTLRKPWVRRPSPLAEATGYSDDDSIWALKDINFDVEEGDVVGIIGRNGAGKSTLLKIISRITDPTEGFARIRGRLASLLEVGTGFHPELTGRENIYLNGAILGMRKAEIETKFDEIVDFGEIGRFLDTPVKFYSSGMYVRLAFAVAAHLNPEILVVDEVLAVGDLAFQKKCLGKMSEVSQGGRTVLFVSHNLAAVQSLCRKGVVLKEGRLVFNGGANDAVDHYMQMVSGPGETSHANVVDLSRAGTRNRKYRPLLRRLELLTDNGVPLLGGIPIGAPLKALIHFRLESPTPSFDVGLGFDNLYGQRIFSAHSAYEPKRVHEVREGEQVFVCEIPQLTLTPGEYKLVAWVEISGGVVDLVEDAARLTIGESDFYGTGKVPRSGTCALENHWRLQ
ncbi:MAG: ABC transporter ATP-binding protein [Acidobacteriia bacterium]|nr:ABC transporter ATP-binding protein [Terriglobia bacterium]